MSTIETLLREIEKFLEESDIAESTFGRRVLNDGKLVERIRQGGGLTVANLDRIRVYMAQQRETFAGRGAKTRRKAA